MSDQLPTPEPRPPRGSREVVGPPGAGELAFYRACRVVAVGSSVAAFPGRVIGRENIPEKGPYILAPVHRSYLDWLIVARLTRRRLRYIVKAEVFRSKAIGRLIGALGAFPVRRSSADREALDRCRAVLAGGEPLVMFPEGTRRSGREVTDLREGVAYLALSAAVPIIPVGIGGSEKAMPKGQKLARPGRVDLVVGRPLVGVREDAGESGTRRRVSRRTTAELSAKVQRAIQQAYDEAELSLATTTITGHLRKGGGRT